MPLAGQQQQEPDHPGDSRRCAGVGGCSGVSGQGVLQQEAYKQQHLQRLTWDGGDGKWTHIIHSILQGHFFFKNRPTEH